MPQIGPDLWKVGLEYFWYREYQDGRTEQEFDLETGQIRLWGPATPPGLKRVGWLPMTPDLAQKIQACGEIGYPTQAPSVLIDLKPGEELICFKDCTVIKGYQVICKACGFKYRTMGESGVCPSCGVTSGWKCDKCGHLGDSQVCPDCSTPGRLITPFRKRPDSWESVTYFLGIQGKFQIKFNSKGLVVEH